MSAAKCRGCRGRFEVERKPGRRVAVYCEECRRKRNAASHQRRRDVLKGVSGPARVGATGPLLTDAEVAAEVARMRALYAPGETEGDDEADDDDSF